MSFTRANPPGWAVGDKVTSAQINALDIDHANSVDKTGDTVTGTIALGATGVLQLVSGSTVLGFAGSSVVLTGGATINTVRADLINPVTATGPLNIGSGTAIAANYLKFAAWQGSPNTQTQQNQRVCGVARTTSTTSTQILSIPFATNTTAVARLSVVGKDTTNFANTASTTTDVMATNAGGSMSVAVHGVSTMSLGTSPLTTVSISSSGTSLIVSVSASSANAIDWQALIELMFN